MKTFLVWFPDDGDTEDDAVEVDAFDPEMAAEDACEECSRCDQGEIDSYQALVAVKAPDGTVTKWRVAASATITYIAEPVE